jgi:hypothetical protein
MFRPACGATTSSGLGGAAFGQINIDASLAAVSRQTGKFEAIRTTSMMVHATYFLPDQGKPWVSGGYGMIYSSNAGEVTCPTLPFLTRRRKKVRPDARQQARNNQRCIRWNTVRIVSGRARRRWTRIVLCRRKVYVGQAPSARKMMRSAGHHAVGRAYIVDSFSEREKLCPEIERDQKQ